MTTISLRHAEHAGGLVVHAHLQHDTELHGGRHSDLCTPGNLPETVKNID